jgi:hypothetical protein
LLSSVLVVAPAPRWALAEEAVVHTEHIRLGTRASRGAQRVAVAGLDLHDARELRAALTDRSRRATGVRRAAVRAIGITVDAPPEGPVLVRSRVDGAWSPWFEVPFAAGETPDVGTEGVSSREVDLHSEPVWLGDADAFELDTPAPTAELDVHLVAATVERRAVELAPTSAGAAGAPSIHSRAAWGARPPQQHPATTADLKLAIVHHSVNGNSYSAAQVPQLLRSIQAYHQGVKGWNDIAYNVVVDRFGRAWEGRAGGLGNVVVGGHSQGFNTGAVGVVVLGDFRYASPPSASVEAVARVIAWKFAHHRVDPASSVPFTSAGSSTYPEGTTVTLPRIVGHADVQATSCPGTHLHNRLGTIRQRVAQLVPAYQSGLTPLLVEAELTGDGLADPIEYRPGTAGDAVWRSSASGPTRVPTAVVGAYRPVSGDFDGNGYTDVLWHGTGSAPDRLWWRSASGTSTSSLAVAGSYTPVAGDFDGNGVDDIFWYATGLAPDSTWWFERNRTHASKTIRQDLITGVPLVGDFDGNGRDDIFWYGPGTADDRVWHSTGRGWKGTDRAVAGWYQPVVLDATGDGRDDILWYEPGASRSPRWDFAAHTSVHVAHPRWLGRPTAGDFDGDGLDDVLVYAPGSTPDGVLYSTPTGAVAKSVQINGTYAVAAGPMDAPVPRATDDLLFMSSGIDILWRGNSNRTFRPSKAG